MFIRLSVNTLNQKIPMKKLLIVALVLMLSICAKAQDVFSLGPKIGYNSNKLINNRDSIRSSLKNTMQIGAFIRVGSKIYVQPEVNYQVVNGSMNSGMGSALLNQDFTIKTIKIPALLGVKLINGGVVNFRVMAGPAVTYMYNKTVSTENVGSLWPVRTVDDIKNSIWSVQVGAGLDVLFLTLDVRYEMGVDNMYNGSSDFEMKNNTFNVSLGIKLL